MAKEVSKARKLTKSVSYTLGLDSKSPIHALYVRYGEISQELS